MWGFRRELARSDPVMRWLVLPCLAGGGAGALLLRHTSEAAFDRIVPFLVLFATLLFMARTRLQQWLRTQAGQAHRTGGWIALALGATLLVAVYGGYFGAGVGILMLAALGFMGLSNIHRMNGLKNWGGLCMNAVAAVTFIVSGIVDWPVALAMALGAAGGGYAGSRLAQRVAQRHVRSAIAVIGLLSGVWLLVRR